MMQVEKESNYAESHQIFQEQGPLYDATEFIPSGYNYLVILFSNIVNGISNTTSFVQPFRDYSVLLKDVVKDLLRKINESKTYKKQYCIGQFDLTLTKGSIIKMQQTQTVDDLRILLAQQSISGLKLCLKEQQKLYLQEAHMTISIQNQQDFNSAPIQREFILLNNNQSFFLNFNFHIKFEDLKKNLVKILSQTYNSLISQKDLSFYELKLITSQDKKNTISWDKSNQMFQEDVQFYLRAQEKQTIGIYVFKQGIEWNVKKCEDDRYLIFVIDEENKIKLNFQQIQNYSISQVLKYLKVDPCDSFGLKIVNQIFRPWQKIQDIKNSKLFQKGQRKYFKNIQCRLVSQRQMFYESMKQFHQDFILSKDVLTQKGQNVFEKCRVRVEEVRSRMQKQKISLLKDDKSISPITYYTSSLELIDQKDKSKSYFLYQGLNLYLRETKIGMMRNVHAEWKNKFTANLMRSLSKLQRYTQEQDNKDNETTIVFRGLKGHQLQGKTGQIFQSKSFLSTSTDRKKAQDFMKRDKTMGTFMQIQCLSGKRIDEFSMYKNEKQVLFVPYTRFLITEKYQQENIYYMKLKELPQKQYVSNSATIVLWIDDKLKQGETVISTMQCDMHTTFLHQLTSTRHLSNWIDENQTTIQNDQINIAVITNMRRFQQDQNGKKVEIKDAGAHTVKLVRQKLPKAKDNTILYIGDIQRTKYALMLNQIDPKSISIYNTRKQLRNFLAQVTKPLPQEKYFQSLVQRQQRSLLQFFQKKQVSSQASSANRSKKYIEDQEEGEKQSNLHIIHK